MTELPTQVGPLPTFRESRADVAGPPCSQSGRAQVHTAGKYSSLLSSSVLLGTRCLFTNHLLLSFCKDPMNSSKHLISSLPQNVSYAHNSRSQRDVAGPTSLSGGAPSHSNRIQSSCDRIHYSLRWDFYQTNKTKSWFDRNHYCLREGALSSHRTQNWAHVTGI